MSITNKRIIQPLLSQLDLMHLLWMARTLCLRGVRYPKSQCPKILFRKQKADGLTCVRLSNLSSGVQLISASKRYAP